MPDEHEPRPITDDTPLAELTVGEFKELMLSILQSGVVPTKPPDAPDEPAIRRKSLDEFMNDLGS